jgi:NTE family protein
MRVMKNKKIGLALSGGGARGLAHIGFLRVLEEEGIQVDMISGTSFGGIIAAAYAAGFSVDLLEKEALRLSRIRELIKLIDVNPARRGLMEGNKVREYMTQLFGADRQIESLPLPLTLNAVDIKTGKEVVFSKGPLLTAIMSTIAIAGVFPAVKYKDYLLVDGGTLNNLPIDHARAMGADIVIAVDVQTDPHHEKAPYPESTEPRGFFSLPEYFSDFYRAQIIMINELKEANLKIHPPDILISPDISPEINMFSGFTRAGEVIEAGKEAAQKNLPELLEMCRDDS